MRRPKLNNSSSHSDWIFLKPRHLRGFFLSACLLCAGCISEDATPVVERTEIKPLDVKEAGDTTLSIDQPIVRQSTIEVYHAGPAAKHEKQEEPKLPGVSFSGRGSSETSPVTIALTPQAKATADQAQAFWLKQKDPAAHIVQRSPYIRDNRYYETVTVLTGKGRRRKVFFDITAFIRRSKH